MTGPQPADELASTFNTLLSLGGDQPEALERAAWTLRGLSVRSRDVLAGLGLMHAVTMLGRPAEAAALGDELWGRRGSMPADYLLDFASMEAALGRHSRSAELADLVEPLLSPALRIQRASLVFELTIQSWDRSLMERYGLPKSSVLQVFQSALDGVGLLPAMQDRQALVNELVAGRQCGSAATIGTDGHAATVLRRTIYVTGDRAARNDLADRLAGALDRFYGAHGVDADEASWLTGEIILPVSARPPVDRAALLALT